MGVYSGPDLKEDGLVLALDGANYKSFKGFAATNLLYSITNAYGEINGTHFKTSYGDEQVFIPMLGYKTVRFCNIYNNYPTSGDCCPSPLRYGGSSLGLGQNIAVSSSTTYTYQIIYKTTSGYTHPNFMYRYEYGASGYVTEGGVHSDSNRTSLGDGWYHAWGQFTTQSTTTYLALTGMWYYQYGVYDKISIAGVSLHQGTFIISPEHILLPQENRGTTVATGGGWADLSGRANHGELVNGVREDSANGGSLVFDGTNDYISIPFETILNDCSIEVWFKATSTRSYQYLLSIGNEVNSSYSFYLDMNDPDGSGFAQTMWVYWNSGGTPYSVIPKTGTYGDWNDSTWRHYVFTRSSTTNHYMNGSLVTNVSRSGDQTTQFGNGSGYKLKIGVYQITNTNAFPGNIAQVKIYNRALTASEIQQNFNATRARFGI